MMAAAPEVHELAIAVVQFLLPRLFFRQKPFRQEVKRLFCLNSRLFSHVEASSIRSDLRPEYFCAFGVTHIWRYCFSGSNGLDDWPIYWWQSLPSGQTRGWLGSCQLAIAMAEPAMDR
jgi:hypothetical protein